MELGMVARLLTLFAAVLMTSAQLSPQEKQMILSEHNRFRTMVANGLLPNQPKATDMVAMRWDDLAAAKAQQLAGHCSFQHSTNAYRTYGPYKFVGENIAYSTIPNPKVLLQLWFDEYKDYNYGFNLCKQGKMCGHYTQIVWSKSSFLGCGAKYCSDRKYYMFCHYGPAGNIINVKPYAITPTVPKPGGGGTNPVIPIPSTSSCTVHDVINAAEKNEIKALKTKGCDISTTKGGFGGIRAIHLAAADGRTNAVLHLLANNVNVMMLDSDQNTALHYSMANKLDSMSHVLLMKSAYINAKNKFGQTPLHFAAQTNFKAGVMLLMSSNPVADKNIRDNKGKLPIDYATDPEIKKVLA